MADRENVLRGLECCSKGADREPTWNNLTARNCGKCPYNKPGIACTRVLSYDALTLLKAQEARLLTKEEIISWEGYIWKEFKGMTAMKALLIDHGMEREPYIGDFPTNSYLWDNYNQYWRCWSTQPTKEQREATAWQS